MPGALLISRYAPPMYDVGGKRVHRFARHLPGHGWTPLVLTSPIPRDRPIDASARPLEGVPVVRELVPTWWPEKRGRPSDATIPTPVQESSSGSRRPPLSRHLALPGGPERLLARRTARRARALARERRLDVVFASSSPYAMLVHGVAAKRATGLPLVLDLRDPWSLNFLQAHRAPRVRRAEQRLERRCFEAADALVFTSERTTEAYSNIYPELAGRMHTVTNAFDGSVLTPTPRDSSAPLRLLHFGNCYGPRSLDTMLRAMARLRDDGSGPNQVPVSLHNLGRVSQRDVDLARQLGLADAFTFEPAVPYEDGLRRLSEADLQVLLGYGDASLFIPAKLFDYMRAGSPVLCLAPDSDVADIVRERALGRVREPLDVAGVCDTLRAAISERRALRSATAPDLDPFSAVATAGQLARIFDEVTRRGGADGVSTPSRSSSSRGSTW